MAAQMDPSKLDIVNSNIVAMNSLQGFDVIIVCCSSDLQASYWQKRLEGGRGYVSPKDSIILAVQEDWPGGAGNGKLYSSTYTLKYYSTAYFIIQNVYQNISFVFLLPHTTPYLVFSLYT